MLVEIEIDESLYARLIDEATWRHTDLVDVLYVAVDLRLKEIQREVKAVA